MNPLRPNSGRPSRSRGSSTLRYHKKLRKINRHRIRIQKSQDNIIRSPQNSPLKDNSQNNQGKSTKKAKV